MQLADHCSLALSNCFASIFNHSIIWYELFFFLNPDLLIGFHLDCLGLICPLLSCLVWTVNPLPFPKSSASLSDTHLFIHQLICFSCECWVGEFNYLKFSPYSTGKAALCWESTETYCQESSGQKYWRQGFKSPPGKHPKWSHVWSRKEFMAFIKYLAIIKRARWLFIFVLYGFLMCSMLPWTRYQMLCQEMTVSKLLL